VFDAKRVIDKATYEQPLEYSEGIQFVLVNEFPSSKMGNSLMVFSGPGGSCAHFAMNEKLP